MPFLGQHITQRLDQEGKDVGGHVPAAEKRDDETDGCEGEAAPELDQMVDQRRARLLDLVDHRLGTRLEGVRIDRGAGGRAGCRRTWIEAHRRAGLGLPRHFA